MERGPRSPRPIAPGHPAVNDNLTPAEVHAELARLIATQHDGGMRQSLAERRRASQLELSRLETRSPVGLMGDELREHTIYQARHELIAAGLDTDGTVREHVNMTLDRADIARRSAALLAELSSKIDAFLEFSETHEAQEFDEHGYRRPRYDSQPWCKIRVVAHNLRVRYDEICGGSLSNADFAALNRPCTAEELEQMAAWLANEPDPAPRLPDWVALSSEPLGFRASLVIALAYAPWTHRLRACASIVLGQWPASIGDEAVASRTVIEIEKENLRRAYYRLTQRGK